MKFKTAIHQGILLKRYKRFFADVDLNGEQVVAHVANTGSLKSVLLPGQECWVSEAENPDRKLKYSLQALKIPSSWVGVNTSWPNLLAKEAFDKKIFAHWHQFDSLQSEVKISKETRLDLLLSNSSKKHYVEIKNVTMAKGIAEKLKSGQGMAQFPDSVTERGQKHLRELIDLVSQGHSAEILFVVQRNDCQVFSAAEEIDPEYAQLLQKAKQAGVIITAASVQMSKKEIVLTSDFLKVQL